MGIYHGSPWGHIRGSIDDTVGGVWKGLEWCRVKVWPTQRGTLAYYKNWKADPSSYPRFSFKQFNIRRIVLQVLGYIARFGSALPNWIYPVWEALVLKRAWTMTGANAFIRRNAATLFDSMPHTDEEFDPVTNTIDLAKMLVSDGDLEPGYGMTASYDGVTGDVSVTWDATTYTNGAPDDIAFLMVAKKPILESTGILGTWRPALFMYGTALVPPPPAVPPIRADVSMSLHLPPGLDAADLTAYLFFRDHKDIIGYSPSIGIQVT